MNFSPVDLRRARIKMFFSNALFRGLDVNAEVLGEYPT